MAKLVPCKYCGCVHTKQSAIYSEDYGYIGYCRCENCGSTVCTTSTDFLQGKHFYGSTRYEAIKFVKSIWIKAMSDIKEAQEYLTCPDIVIIPQLSSYEVTYKDDGHTHTFRVHSMKDLYEEIRLYNKYLGKDEDVLPAILYKENYEL